MMTPRSFPETGFSVTVRNVLTPSLPAKRQPAGTLIVASDPSAPFAGPRVQGILSACAAPTAGKKARQTARREMIERAIMQPPANRVRRESGGALFSGNNIVNALKNATRRALSAFRQLIDHKSPDAPPALFPAPDGRVAAGAVDRRAGLGSLNLIVRADVHGVRAGDDEIGALQGERRNAVRRHLRDDQRVHGRAIQVRTSGKQEPDVAREPAQRHGGIALEPGLTVLLERGVDRRTICRDVVGRRCRGPARGNHEGDQERAGGGDFHSAWSVVIDTSLPRQRTSATPRTIMKTGSK